MVELHVYDRDASLSTLCPMLLCMKVTKCNYDYNRSVDCVESTTCMESHTRNASHAWNKSQKQIQDLQLGHSEGFMYSADADILKKKNLLAYIDLRGQLERDPDLHRIIMRGEGGDPSGLTLGLAPNWARRSMHAKKKFKK